MRFERFRVAIAWISVLGGQRGGFRLWPGALCAGPAGRGAARGWLRWEPGHVGDHRGPLPTGGPEPAPGPGHAMGLGAAPNQKKLLKGAVPGPFEGFFPIFSLKESLKNGGGRGEVTQRRRVGALVGSGRAYPSRLRELLLDELGEARLLRHGAVLGQPGASEALKPLR